MYFVIINALPELKTTRNFLLFVYIGNSVREKAAESRSLLSGLSSLPKTLHSSNCVQCCLQSEHLSSCWLCPPLVPPHHKVIPFQSSVFLTFLSSIGWIPLLIALVSLPRASAFPPPYWFYSLLDMRGSKFSQMHGPGQQKSKCPPLWERL